MAATLTALTATLLVQFRVSAGKSTDLSSPLDKLLYTFQQEYTFGAGALQANALWHDQFTIAGGGAGFKDIDLAGGESDGFGDAVDFANVKVLFIENLVSNPADCIFSVGNAAAGQFDTWLGGATDLIKIHPGEAKILISRVDANGYVSVGGDNILRVLNAGVLSAEARVVILGDSA